MGDERTGLDRFDEYAAEQRRYWQALLDGGALTPEEQAEALRREIKGE